jgi:hypothetical protein
VAVIAGAVEALLILAEKPVTWRAWAVNQITPHLAVIIAARLFVLGVLVLVLGEILLLVLSAGTFTVLHETILPISAAVIAGAVVALFILAPHKVTWHVGAVNRITPHLAVIIGARLFVGSIIILRVGVSFLSLVEVLVASSIDPHAISILPCSDAP